MREQPALTQKEDHPIVMTYKQSDDRNLEKVKAYTNEPTPTDAALRLINDDLFRAHNIYNFDNCKLSMTCWTNAADMLDEYVGSYVLKSNA